MVHTCLLVLKVLQLAAWPNFAALACMLMNDPVSHHATKQL